MCAADLFGVEKCNLTMVQDARLQNTVVLSMVCCVLYQRASTCFWHFRCFHEASPVFLLKVGGNDGGRFFSRFSARQSEKRAWRSAGGRSIDQRPVDGLCSARVGDERVSLRAATSSERGL